MRSRRLWHEHDCEQCQYTFVAGILVTPEQKNRVEKILYGLAGLWDDPRSRFSLLKSVFDGHEIWLQMDTAGSQQVAARNLLEQLALHDPRLLQGERPVCALLAYLQREVAPQYPELRSLIDSLLTELRNNTSNSQRPQWSQAPYPGLSYFDRRHAPIYFGREDELQDLVEALSSDHGKRFLIVVGASGSGKSSLVRAGLWAGLEAGRYSQWPDSQSWLISVMTPTDMDSPMDSLRAALNSGIDDHDEYSRPTPDLWTLAVDRADDGAGGLLMVLDQVFDTHPEGQWLLILDQMEELFTAFDEKEREIFIDQLIAATRPRADGRNAPLRVISTLRADCFHSCVAHPNLRFIAQQGRQFLLGPPSQRALERMITGPLTDVDLVESGTDTCLTHWQLDPELAPRMAADAVGFQGGLAVMAFVLRELFEKCKQQRQLSLEEYLSADFGGLSGAIARRAEAVMDALGAGADLVLQRVFTLLIHVDEEHVATRRRAPASTWEQDEEALKLIDAFVKARLLVTDRGRNNEPSVEVAHEALLREWPALSEWIKTRGEALHLCNQIRKETRSWVIDGRTRQRPWPAERIDRARSVLDRAGLLNTLENVSDIKHFLSPERNWLLTELGDAQIEHERRALIGRRLAVLGDERCGVNTDGAGLPEIDWVSIPAGEFIYQDDKRQGIEGFQISRYPVTNAQFQAFIDAEDGYRDDRWWQGMTVRPNERQPRPPGWPLSNHPREKVSWFEASAFCAWLRHRLHRDVKLPTEQQWERTARGLDGRIYPWGSEWQDEYCNTEESGLHRTTAVGLYPQGASIEGVLDLSGNVWEWCRNEYTKPKRIQPKGREARVLRGGSWIYFQFFARTDDRYYERPGVRFDSIGFRLVCEPPIAAL